MQAGECIQNLKHRSLYGTQNTITLDPKHFPVVVTSAESWAAVTSQLAGDSPWPRLIV